MLAFVCAVGVLVTPAFVSAETVLRTGSDVSVAPDQTVAGNYYVSVLFGKTTMSGVVEKDMIAIGGSVTHNGEVKEDLQILGGNVQVHGPVNEDLRIVGGEVTIAERVGGDVVVLGGVLTVLPTAEIAGDVFFFGGSAEISGTVGGSVYGSGELITINGTVAKTVDVKAIAGFELGERANVAGDVRYTSSLEIVRHPNAVVGGELVYNTQAPETAKEHARTLLVPFLIFLFTTLAIYLIFKRELERLVPATLETYVVSSFVGLGIFVFGPIFSIILILTVLGSLVGFMSLTIVVTLTLAGIALAPIFAGALLSRVLGRGTEISLLSIVAGAVTLYALLFVPGLGMLIVALLALLGIGGLTMALYRAMA